MWKNLDGVGVFIYALIHSNESRVVDKASVNANASCLYEQTSSMVSLRRDA
jgi:hypothetical protein